MTYVGVQQEILIPILDSSWARRMDEVRCRKSQFLYSASPSLDQHPGGTRLFTDVSSSGSQFRAASGRQGDARCQSATTRQLSFTLRICERHALQSQMKPVHGLSATPLGDDFRVGPSFGRNLSD